MVLKSRDEIVAEAATLADTTYDGVKAEVYFSLQDIAGENDDDMFSEQETLGYLALMDDSSSSVIREAGKVVREFLFS